MSASSMTAIELRAALSLSMVFFLRMLPLFMLLPVLALAESQYSGATPLLLGLALGIYGLTQATLQIPFGILSDRFGRKPIITIGLLIFILGSLLAAISESIYGLIVGRAFQGAGAIAAAMMALASDVSSEQSRTKIMAIIGISIGMAFSLAFILGPFLYTYIDIKGLFYIGAAFGLLAIVMLLTVVPNPTALKKIRTKTINLSGLTVVFFKPQLLRFNYSIFTSHLILMANFVVIPIALRDHVGLTTHSHWQLYLSVLICSLFIMVPFIIFSERFSNIKSFFIVSILLIIISQTGLILFHSTLVSIGIFLILFFGAFNYLEALLPSEVSKTASADQKGTALGIYSTSQFLGIFIGGAIGGLIYQEWGLESVHIFCLIMSCFWLSIIIFSNGPFNHTINVGEHLTEKS